MGASSASDPIDGDETAVVSHHASSADVVETAVGDSIGRYVVLEEIGRGGMGRVLRAYDPKLQREIALKELRCIALTPAMTRRLVAEARAMAKLSHPNVVAVYDVEELDEGRVVLVMEYVPGTTLRAWLEMRERSWIEVVRAYIRAGRGLVAAHDAELLHRDFKPVNVLVSHDGSVKVTDFGLAKAEGSPSSGATERSDEELCGLAASWDGATPLTEEGVVMGTPRYMAPEQHRGLALSAAADQYSFCIALWEALVGEPPFTGDEVWKQKFSGPPVWPVSSTPRPISEAIRRGLAVKPEARWPDLRSLLEALEYDPARTRRRWTTGLSMLGVAGLVGGSWQAWASARSERCSGARQQLENVWDDGRRTEVRASVTDVGSAYAEFAWTRVSETLDRYAAEWVEIHEDACEASTIRGEQSSTILDLRMRCLDQARSTLEATVDVFADADAEVVQKASAVLESLRPLSRCSDIAALQADVEPPLPEDERDVAFIMERLDEARAQKNAGRLEQAMASVEAARARAGELDYGPVLMEMSMTEAEVLEELGKYGEAEGALRNALELASRWSQWETQQRAALNLMHLVGHHQRLPDEALRYLEIATPPRDAPEHRRARVRSAYASILTARGEFEEAVREHRRALVILEKEFGSDDPKVASERLNLASALVQQGAHAEAQTELEAVVDLRERTLGPDHPALARARGNLAGVLIEQGKLEAGEAELRGVLETEQQLRGAEHPQVARTRSNLGVVLTRQGKYAEAQSELSTALATLQAAKGPEHPDIAVVLEALGGVAFYLRDYAAAETRLREALKLREATQAPGHPEIAQVSGNLGSVLVGIGKPAEGEVELRKALDLWEHSLGPEHPNTAYCRFNLGVSLAAQEKHAEAASELRATLAIQGRVLDSRHPNVADSRAVLAESLMALGKLEEALTLAELAWARHEASDTPAERRGKTAFLLARLLRQTSSDPDTRARALELAREAIPSFEAAQGDYEDELEQVRAWLSSD